MTMSERYGIDVSTAQGVIDWAKLAQNKDLSFVIIRGLQSTSEDTKFAENIAGATRYGIPYGLYFASSATTPAAVQNEAEAAINLLRDLNPTFGVWYDMELGIQKAMGKQWCTEAVIAWCDALAAAGYRPGVYSNKAWLDSAYYADQLRPYGLWYAAYPSSGDKILTGAPADNRPKLSYPYAALWQWSSSGKVDGIKGYVDLDVCYDDSFGLKQTGSGASGSGSSQLLGKIPESSRSAYAEFAEALYGILSDKG